MPGVDTAGTALALLLFQALQLGALLVKTCVQISNEHRLVNSQLQHAQKEPCALSKDLPTSWCTCGTCVSGAYSSRAAPNQKPTKLNIGSVQCIAFHSAAEKVPSVHACAQTIGLTSFSTTLSYTCMGATDSQHASRAARMEAYVMPNSSQYAAEYR